MSASTSVTEVVATQAIAAGAGAAIGAVTKHAITPRPGAHHGQFAMQVGSAVGAAAATGAGVSGSLAAGAAVVTGKVAAAAALATAAAPVVLAVGLGGAAVYGLYRLLKA